MRGLVALGFSLILATAAFADPVITSITPNSGPAAGGTSVIIHGTGFSDNCVICSPPFANPEVHFGTVRADFVNFIDSTALEVITPPHLPGSVTVTVRNHDGTPQAFKENAFTYEGVEEGSFDPILLPIFMPPVKGAFGSEFVTRAHMYNQGPVNPTYFFGLDTSCYLFGPPLYAENQRAIGDTQQMLLPGCNESTGLLLYTPKGAGRSLAISLRVADITRQAQSHGVEIPVAHVDDFRTTPIALLDIPVDPRFRTTLRIYSYRWNENMPVTVTIDDQDVRHIQLTKGRNQFDPAFAVITDFPAALEGQVQRRIVVDGGGKPVWAFVSVTNNETQEITVVSPN